tara:strand:+ start:1145 stop:1891 length:747 start_codon:yes stop_codon:yes gene_type:complete
MNQYKMLTAEEHEERFLQPEYLPTRREFPTMTHENFLSEKEIELMNYYWNHPERMHIVDRSMQSVQEEMFGPGEYKTAEYNIFGSLYKNPWWAGIKEMLVPKVQKWLGHDIYIPHCHVLDSHYPYGIHTDNEQAGFVLAPHPAWTIIIPLEDYNSKTYIFNEISVGKHPTNLENKSDDMCISEEEFEKDFAGLATPKDWLKKLTLDGAYPWKAGSAICSDRYKYHSSDNYYNHGLKNKRAIIMWTTHT